MAAAKARTVSYRRARASHRLALACALVFALMALYFTLAWDLLYVIAPAVGLVASWRVARSWERAIRRARTAPDEARWTPSQED